MEGYIGGTALPTNVTLGNCIPSMSYLVKRVTNINGQTCMSNSNVNLRKQDYIPYLLEYLDDVK